MSNISFVPDRWTLKFRKNIELKPNKMLYKLLSHVDLSGEIMPRKLMELALGTPMQWFIHLCAFLSKNTCLQNEPLQTKDRKIKLPRVCRTCSIRLTYIFKKQSRSLHAWRKYSRTLTYLSLFGEHFPGVAIMFQRWPHPQIQANLVGLSVGELLFVCLFVLLSLCLRSGLVHVLRRPNTEGSSVALTFGADSTELLAVWPWVDTYLPHPILLFCKWRSW